MAERQDEKNMCLQKESSWTSLGNRSVFISKAFYVFFYTAIGALFPYLPVYFKQLRLSPHQIGILIGVRPLIQFCVTPFWGVCADKYRKSKAILLMSIIGWLLSNFALSLVPQSEESQLCDKRRRNFTDHEHEYVEDISQMNATSVSRTLIRNSSTTTNKESHDNYYHVTPNSSHLPYSFSTSVIPWTLEIMKEEDMIFEDFPPYVSCDSDVFVFLLVVTVIGTAISAPTHMMADTATLKSLEGETHKYGKVRLWGSLGWGVGGFSVGAAVSSNVKTLCTGEVIIDYLPCFYVYALSMSIAFLCATQFQYDSKTSGSETCSSDLKDGLKVLTNPRYCFIMFIAYFCGSATGFIETFLFWYLHELGGGQLLFSTVNGLNCAGEVAIFFITDYLLSRLGHINVIYMALLFYAVRFLYFYFVTSPWAVLPAELLQGITTAAFWAASVSYVGLHPGASHTLQGILNGLYMGLGFATGGFLGGMLVHIVGLPQAFLVYAVASLLILLVLVLINKT